MGEEHLTTARLRAVHGQKKAREATKHIEWLAGVARHTESIGGVCMRFDSGLALMKSWLPFIVIQNSFHILSHLSS